MPLKVYPVRNNAPLLPPGQRPSGPAAAAGLDFRIIPAGFNAPLGFESRYSGTGISNGVYWNGGIMEQWNNGLVQDLSLAGDF